LLLLRQLVQPHQRTTVAASIHGNRNPLLHTIITESPSSTLAADNCNGDRKQYDPLCPAGPVPHQTLAQAAAAAATVMR
jgi:hypothetical protein